MAGFAMAGFATLDGAGDTVDAGDSLARECTFAIEALGVDWLVASGCEL